MFDRYSVRLRYPWIRSRALTLASELIFDAEEERIDIRFGGAKLPLSLDRLRVLRAATDGTMQLPNGGALSGRAFNIGGGPENALTPNELVSMIETVRGIPPTVRFERWRDGDKKFYISNTTAFSQATGWRPRVGPRAGVEALHGWLSDQRAPASAEGSRHA